MFNRRLNNDEKTPIEAKGDCTICKGWKNDGRGGCCIFASDYWLPSCSYEKRDNV